MRLRFCLPSLLVLSLLPVSAAASTNGNATFLVHLTAPVGKNPCNLRANPPGCSAVQSAGQIGPGYFAYVLIDDVDPIGGVSDAKFGISYDSAPGVGVDVHSWTPCSDLEFPSTGWPNSGGGILLTWGASTCHHTVTGTGAVVVAGYFYMSAYTPDELVLTQRPVDNRLALSDCAGQETLLNPWDAGWVAFSYSGLRDGSKPCGFFGPGCRIRGPETVGAGQTGITYTMDPRDVSSEGFWQVQGGARVVGSDTSTLLVDALGPGSFQVTYSRGTGCPEGCGSCSMPVSVGDPTPVESTSWSRIKAVYRSGR